MEVSRQTLIERKKEIEHTIAVRSNVAVGADTYKAASLTWLSVKLTLMGASEIPVSGVHAFAQRFGPQPSPEPISQGGETRVSVKRLLVEHIFTSED